MKKILPILFILLALSGKAQTNINVVYSFLNGLNQNQRVVQVSFTPMSLGIYSNAFVIGDENYRVVTGNKFTNQMISGFGYRVKYFRQKDPDIITAIFTNWFGTNVSGTVYATDYVAISTNLGSGIYAYSQAQSDARYPTFATATNIALVVAQSVVNTNAGGGGGGVTNGGGVLSGMLTNATFSAGGSNAIKGVAIDLGVVTNNANGVTLGTLNLGNATLGAGILNLWDTTGGANVTMQALDGAISFNATIDVPGMTSGGSVSAANFIGDGSQLTGLPRQQTNQIVIYNTNTYSTSTSPMVVTSTVAGKKLFEVKTDIAPSGSGGQSFGHIIGWAEPNDLYVPATSYNSGASGLYSYLGTTASEYIRGGIGGDYRLATIVPTAFGTNGIYGVALEFLNKRNYFYSTVAQSSFFVHPIKFDTFGGTSLGDNPDEEHTKDWISTNSWVRIRGSSDNTRSQFQLEGTGKPFIGTLTNGAFFNDGTNVSLVQNGVNSPIATLGASNNFTGGLYANGAAVLTAAPSLGFGGMRPFNGNSSSSAYIYTSIFGGYDSSTAANHGQVIQPGTYTNFWGNHVYPSFTGTNFYLILTNNGSGTYVEAMRAYRINASANAQNLWSNTTTSFRVSVPTVVIIAMSNSLGTITAPFTSWSIQKY